MRSFILLNFALVVSCLAKPDVSNLANNDYLPPAQEQRQFSNVETPASSLSSISLSPNKNRHAQIESIQPSIPLASFSVQTTVALPQSNTQTQQAYTQQTEQATQSQIRGSYNYNTPQSLENSFTSPASVQPNNGAPQVYTSPVSNQEAYKYNQPTAAVPQRYEQSTTFQQQNSVEAVMQQNNMPSSSVQHNIAPQTSYQQPTTVQQNDAAPIQQQPVPLPQTVTIEQTNVPRVYSQQVYSTSQNPSQTYLPPIVPQQRYGAPSQQQPVIFPQQASVEQSNVLRESSQQSYNTFQISPQNSFLPTAAPQNNVNSIPEQPANFQQVKSNEIINQQSYNTANNTSQSYLPPTAVQQSYAAPSQQQPTILPQSVMVEQPNVSQQTNQQSYNAVQNPSSSYLPPQQNIALLTQQHQLTTPQTFFVEQTRSTETTNKKSLNTAQYNHQSLNTPQNPSQGYLAPIAVQQNHAATLQQQQTVPSQLYSTPQTVSVTSNNIPQVTSTNSYNTAASPSRTYLTPVTVQQNNFTPHQAQNQPTVSSNQISPTQFQPTAPAQTFESQSAPQTAPYNYQSSNPTGPSNYNAATTFTAQTTQQVQHTSPELVQPKPQMPTGTYNYNPAPLAYPAPITGPAQISQPAYNYRAPLTAPQENIPLLQQTQHHAVQPQTQTVNSQNYAPRSTSSHNYNNPASLSSHYQQPFPAITQSNSNQQVQTSSHFESAPVQTTQPIQASGIQSSQSPQSSAASPYNYQANFQTSPEVSTSHVSNQRSDSYNYHAPSGPQQGTILHESQPVQKIELSITSASNPVITEVRTSQDTEYDQNGGYIYRRH